MMFRIMMIFMVLMQTVVQVLSQPPACLEDTQCVYGFYCVQDAWMCSECLHCDQYKREAPLLAGFCVKTIIQCGPCLDGFEERTKYEECVPNGDGAGGAPHALLPGYVWATIGVAVLLMIITIYVLFKTNVFRVMDFTSLMSVQTVHAEAAAPPHYLPPPPYNGIPLPELAPSFPQPAPEIQPLFDSSESHKTTLSPMPADRSREASANQAARVYHHPAYERVPHAYIRCETPEDTLPTPEQDPAVSQSSDVPSQLSQTSQIINKFSSTNAPEGQTSEETIAQGKRTVPDSNNNRSSSDGVPAGDHIVAPCQGGCFIGGPSFVINVVKNINSVYQSNDVEICPSDSV